MTGNLNDAVRIVRSALADCPPEFGRVHIANNAVVGLYRVGRGRALGRRRHQAAISRANDLAKALDSALESS